MKRITKVVAHNFKSLKDNTIYLDNFTAIIGPTNSGKSTIVKIIKLCLYNEPSGDRFITHGETLCWGEVWFDDNTGIRRTKGRGEDKDINKYEIIHADGKIDEYTNFGNGPFEPVVSFHGMPKVNLFGEEECLNICDQLSAPFFLASTNGKRAKMIGKLAKTDVADTALHNINLEVRRRKQLQKKYKEELKEKEEDLKQLDNLPQAEFTLEAMRLKLDDAKGKQEKLNRILAIKEELDVLYKKRDGLTSYIEGESQLYNAIGQIDKLILLNNKANRILSLQINLVNALKEKEETQSLLTAIDMDRLNIIVQNMDKIFSMITTIATIQKIYGKLNLELEHKENVEDIAQNIKNIEEITGKLDQCKDKVNLMNQVLAIKFKIDTESDRVGKGTRIIKELEQSYEQKFTEYKQALISNKQCPICQSEITDEKVASIKDLI